MNRPMTASRKIIEFIDEWAEKYSGLPRTPLPRTPVNRGKKKAGGKTSGPYLVEARPWGHTSATSHLSVVAKAAPPGSAS